MTAAKRRPQMLVIQRRSFLDDLKCLLEPHDTIFDELLPHFLHILFVKGTHRRPLFHHVGTLFEPIYTVSLLVVSYDLLLAHIFTPLERSVLPPDSTIEHLIGNALQHRHCFQSLRTLVNRFLAPQVLAHSELFVPRLAKIA